MLFNQFSLSCSYLIHKQSTNHSISNVDRWRISAEANNIPFGLHNNHRIKLTPSNWIQSHHRTSTILSSSSSLIIETTIHLRILATPFINWTLIINQTHSSQASVSAPLLPISFLCPIIYGEGGCFNLGKCMFQRVAKFCLYDSPANFTLSIVFWFIT